jgi:hypothetical protein
MVQVFVAKNHVNRSGAPAGGWVQGAGLSIQWQDGPLGRGEERREPNGCFVETVIAAAIQRIEFYEHAGFGCPENRAALECLRLALDSLEQRTARREAEGVEGTHLLGGGDDQPPTEEDVSEGGDQ